MSKITFKQLMEQCAMRVNGLIEEDKFRELISNNVKIKKYKSLVDKDIIISKIMVYAEVVDVKDTGPADYCCNLSHRYCFDILMSYTDLAIKREDKTIDNYDLIMESGLADIVLETCHNDYNRCVEMIRDALRFKDAMMFESLMSGFDTDKIDSTVEKLTKFAANTEIMDKILRLMEYNDPGVEVVKKVIAQKTQVDKSSK